MKNVERDTDYSTDSFNRRNKFITLFSNKFFWLVVVAIILIIFASAIYFKKKQVAEVASKKLTEAQQSYKKGDLPTTEKNLIDSLTTYSNNPKALAAFIETIAVQGSVSGTESQAFERGKVYIEYGTKYFPQDPSVLLSIGYLYETSGEYDKALGFYNDSLNIDQNSSEAYFRKGHVLQFLDRKEEAVTAYNQSLQIDPDNPFTLLILGCISNSEGRSEEALTQFRKAYEMNDASPQLRSEALAAASLVKASQIVYMEEATQLARQAVEADPNFAPANSAYGYILSINGNANDGIKFLVKSTSLNPRISRNYNLLGLIHRSIKKYPEAISYQNEAIRRVDNDNTLLGSQERNVAKARYLYDLALTYDKSGNDLHIISLLKQAVLLNPAIKTKIIDGNRKYNFFSRISKTNNLESL